MQFGYFACEKTQQSCLQAKCQEMVGSGEQDLRCRSILTVCQRRLGLSEAEDTRLEQYSFLEDKMSLWYWLRRDLKEDQSAAE